jgi:hypothetical protein
MDKTKAGLLGAVATLATLGAAHAATSAAVNPADALQAASYSDLLAPVQNAVAVMKADDAARARKQEQRQAEGDVQLAQYYYGPEYYHHHHHHHHAYYRRYHHHHHHHHHNAFIGVPGVGGVIVR